MAIAGLNQMSVTEGCEAIKLNRRRFYRWLDIRPKAKRAAWNRITLQEEGTIVEAAKDERLCDLRAAGLMVYGHDSGKFYCSVSTIQRTLRRNELQAPYVVPTKRRPVKPDIRDLIGEPKKVFSYDETDFYLTNGLRVPVIPILDIGSRKFIHYGVRVRSFFPKNFINIFY